MADPFNVGLDGKAYQGPAGNTPSTEIEDIRDVTVSGSTETADATTRGGGGWRSTIATLKDLSVSFTMMHDPTDPSYQAIRDAFLNKQALALSFLNKANGEGPDADWYITQKNGNVYRISHFPDAASWRVL